MSHIAPSLADSLAGLRAAVQAESVHSHRAGALDAVVTALVIRLLLQLEHLYRRFQASGGACAASRVTRIAGRPFIARTLRQPPLWDWLVGLTPATGLRPAALPRPQHRAARAHPLRNAPH